LRRQPVEAGENAGQGAGEIRHAVGNDLAAGVGESGGVAIGVDDDAGALPRQSRQFAVEDGRAGDFDERFVLAT